MHNPINLVQHLPVGSSVELGHTDRDEKTAWTVTAHTGPDTLVMEREATAPWASLDSIMGNGPVPDRVRYERSMQMLPDGTCTTLSEEQFVVPRIAA